MPTKIQTKLSFRSVIATLVLVVVVSWYLLGHYNFAHNNYSYAYTSNNIEVRDLTLTQLTIRQELGLLLNMLNLTVGAEVGVQKGLFTKDILTQWKINKKYILIDPWIQQINYADHANINQNEFNSYFEITKKNTEKWKDQIEIIKNISSVAAKRIKNNSLDFVYLDARHDYMSMNEDLELFWPKLKLNGIFSGHDYEDANDAPLRSGQDWCLLPNGQRCKDNKAVKSAVNEFVAKHARLLYVTTGKKNWKSWYFKK
eukprot:355255_1